LSSCQQHSNKPICRILRSILVNKPRKNAYLIICTSYANPCYYSTHFPLDLLLQVPYSSTRIINGLAYIFSYQFLLDWPLQSLCVCPFSSSHELESLKPTYCWRELLERTCWRPQSHDFGVRSRCSRDSVEAASSRFVATCSGYSIDTGRS
jgi:hypothetical protein